MVNSDSARPLIIRTVVGVAYPGYRSLKALLTEDKADDMLWLRYWVLLCLTYGQISSICQTI